MRRALMTAVSLLLALPTVASAASLAGDASVSWLWLGLGIIAFGVLTGTGIMPSGATATELTAVTRRSFVPKNVVQIYKATPTLAAGLSNAQTASGGVSSVTVPVQGSPFVTAQPTDYSGAFTQPANLQGITEADYNLKALVVPIPFLGMEGIVQQDAAIVPLLEARMNDAGNATAAYLSNKLFTNSTNGTTDIDGLPLIAATTGTYGNIARGTPNTWWNGFARTASATAPTRTTVNQDIIAATKAAGGEIPNIGVMGPGTWAALAGDFLGVENYRVTPGTAFSKQALGTEAGFIALSVASVPIYIDLDCPEGSLFLFNTRYTAFYIHEAAAFAFTGFASTLPNMQLGYIGAMVVVLEFLSVKPATVARITGYSSFITV